MDVTVDVARARRGYKDEEIEEMFAKYDVDGDRNLDELEQSHMQSDLEGQKVRFETSQ